MANSFLTPRLVASAQLTSKQGKSGGALVLRAQPAVGLAVQLAPFYRGDKGDPGDVASEAAIRAIAANQDTVQIFDFDALVATNLGA